MSNKEKSPKNTLDIIEIQELYYIKNKSLRDIAKIMGVSHITIRNYINSHNEEYRRANPETPEIRQGVIRNNETMKRIKKNLKINTKITHSKVECQYCNNEFSMSVLSRHEPTCDSNEEYINSLKRCAENECEVILQKQSADYCRIHYIKYYKRPFEIGSDAGKKGTHKRYHHNRGIYSEFCDYCIEYCTANNITIYATKKKVLEELKSGSTLNEIGKKFGVSKGIIRSWREQLISDSLL